MWRWIVLGALAGCAKQYGSFVEVEGQTHAIDFDRVELHFGTRLDAPASLATPGHPQGLTGKLFARDVAPADEEPAGALTREHAVYLTGATANAGLSYVLAVAFAHDVPVGIGELFELTVPDDRTLIYHLTLEPYVATEVERWGRDRTDCVAWTHARDGASSTVAVVRTDDHDCDSFSSADDCDDASYCAADACATLSVCGAGSTCAIGRCTNHRTGATTCDPVTCVIPGMCDGNCVAFAGPDDVSGRELCGIGLSLQHGELLVPSEQGLLCMLAGATSYDAVFQLPNGEHCLAPMVEFVDPRTPGFTYAIHQDPPTGGCTLSITPITPTQQLGGDHHIMVSFQPADLSLPRWSLVIGIAAATPSPCTAPAQFTPSGELSDCH